MGLLNLDGKLADPIRQGAAYTLAVTVYSGTSTGPALNLTGYTLAGSLKQHYDSTSASGTFAVTAVSATAGSLRVAMASSVTGVLTNRRYVYDVDITSSAGVKTRVLEGCAYVTPSVT